MEDIASKYLAVCNYQFGDFMHYLEHTSLFIYCSIQTEVEPQSKKIRRQCAFLSYFLIRRSRLTHFHLKKTFYVFFKKTFYKRSFSAFGRKVYLYVLIKFQICMCYYHGAPSSTL